MTPEQKAALEWLETCASYVSRKLGPSCSAADSDHRATLKAILAEPRMPDPDELSAGAVEAMCRALGRTPSEVMALYRALYAHLTKPATKEVEVWHVEYWDAIEDEPKIGVCADSVIAEARALSYREFGHRCIRVTGPHRQEVPVNA